MEAIAVTDLWRRYGRTTGFDAVRGVSFDVRPGELFALLGTNGAGKTSVMEVLAGLTPPSSGTVRVLGEDPWRCRAQVRPRVGILLQSGELPGDLTVGEAARLWAGTLSAPRPVPEALELLDLTSRVAVPLKQLSGGERRRVGLALAVLGRPELLLLDEPTAGLDPESRSRVWRLLRTLLASGTTVLLTTHYLQEAEELADRLAILHGGRVVRSGTPAQVTAGLPAHVVFSLPPGTSERPPRRPGTPCRERATPEGVEVVLTTQDLQGTLDHLLAWAGAQGVELRGLHARPASLEEAFLGIAELSRDDAA